MNCIIKKADAKRKRYCNYDVCSICKNKSKGRIITRNKNEDSEEISFTKFENKKITNGIEYFENYETLEYPHIIGLLTTVFDVNKLRSTGYGNEKTKSKDTFMYLNFILTGDVAFIKECVVVYKVHKKLIF